MTLTFSINEPQPPYQPPKVVKYYSITLVEWSDLVSLYLGHRDEEKDGGEGEYDGCGD